jgi:hypothetical protein
LLLVLAKLYDGAYNSQHPSTMSRLRLYPYFVAPAAILFAACENSINQGEVTQVFRRSASGGITEIKTTKDIAQNLPQNIPAVDGPRVKTIVGSNPGKASSTGKALVNPLTEVPFQWHNRGNVVIAALGSGTVGKARAEITDPKLGYVYYKIWTPVDSSGNYPGILDEQWSQGNGLDTDNSKTFPLVNTPLQAGSLRFVKGNDSQAVTIKGRLARPGTYNGNAVLAGTWWTWTAKWNPDSSHDRRRIASKLPPYGRGSLTWADGPLK